VYASSAVLPAPPDTSAHCASAWNAAVWVRPIMIVGHHGVGSNPSRRTASSANNTTVPIT
jgi:hypothetical protein